MLLKSPILGQHNFDLRHSKRFNDVRNCPDLSNLIDKHCATSIALLCMSKLPAEPLLRTQRYNRITLFLLVVV